MHEIQAVKIIAKLTFREAVRRKVVLAALIIGVIFLILFNIGFYMIRLEVGKMEGSGLFVTLAQKEYDNFLHLAGLYTVNFLCVAMAALLAADTLAGEISSGTIQTIVTKPIRRSSVVLGKWLGFAALLALYLVLMAGGVSGSVFAHSRFVAPNLLSGLGLILLESLVIMSVTIMCSSRFSAMATGAVVFGLYGLSFIGGWIEQFGSFANSPTAIQVGVISSLIIPSEALWRRAAYEMQSALAGIAGMTPFYTISVPSPAMVVYAVLYALIMIWLTVRHFDKRDL